MSLTPKTGKTRGPQLLKVIPQRTWHDGCRTLQERSQNPKVPSRASLEKAPGSFRGRIATWRWEQAEDTVAGQEVEKGELK